MIVRSAGSFYRAAIPKDITSGAPNPSEWGKPSATLSSTQCNIGKYFSNHSIIFGEQSHFVRTGAFVNKYHTDITFCGESIGGRNACLFSKKMQAIGPEIHMLLRDALELARRD
jgi:hypothetical protein